MASKAIGRLAAGPGFSAWGQDKMIKIMDEHTEMQTVARELHVVDRGLAPNNFC